MVRVWPCSQSYAKDITVGEFKHVIVESGLGLWKTFIQVHNVSLKIPQAHQLWANLILTLKKQGLMQFRNND